MKTVQKKSYIYEPRLGGATVIATVMIILMGIFGTKWFAHDSLGYGILGFLALIGFVVFGFPVLNKQVVTVRGASITFSSRWGVLCVCKMPDDLSQIIIKDEKPVTFVFKVGNSSVQVSPLGYKNGDQLLDYFEKAMRKGKVVAEIVRK